MPLPAAGCGDGGGAPAAREDDLREPREERRLATVLAAELAVGGTPAEDPESARTIRTAALARLEQEVQRHGGAIEHVVGDQVLALFGIPHGHEDDAERAVRAAVSALDSLRDVGTGQPPSVVVRIAVEAGDLLVTHDGAGRRTLTGRLIGTVERPLAAAPPDRVVVGQGARSATADAVEYFDPGEQALEVGAGEGPLEGPRDLTVVLAEAEQALAARS